MDKQFAVLGLGSFGSSVALTLENMGCDVLVVDESYEKVQEISDKVSYAVKADVSEPDALQALGGRNLDGVVVAISESLEASIMATMLCKEMGIPLVVAKAKDKLQGAILQRVGARIVSCILRSRWEAAWQKASCRKNLWTGSLFQMITVW